MYKADAEAKYKCKPFQLETQVAKLYMVSWSRAEDSEEVRHVIDSTGKVGFKIDSTGKVGI